MLANAIFNLILAKQPLSPYGQLPKTGNAINLIFFSKKILLKTRFYRMGIWFSLVLSMKFRYTK